ncbi:MAG TPA: hypothetical protein VKZ50_19825 [bacterium]|nr:hypothetical protein [bacterium]
MVNDARAIRELTSVCAPNEAARTTGRSIASVWMVLLVCAAAYVTVGLTFSSSRGFWSPDSAVRFVQVESLLRHGADGVAVTYPAASLDPAGTYFPFGPWFHFVRHGRYYVSYPPYFPALVAPLYRSLGNAGLVLLPFLAGLGTVWVTHGVLARTAPVLAGWGALALGLATPLAIYSAVFWDHAPVVFLSAAALALAVRACDSESARRTLDLELAGALLGLALWLRNEIYVLIPAVLAAWVCVAARDRVRGAIAMIAGLVVPVGVLWALNRALSGSLLGWKGEGLAASRVHGVVATATGHEAAAWITDKLGNAYFQLISIDYYSFNPHAVGVGALLATGLLVAGLLLRAGAARGGERALAAGGVLGVTVGLLLFAGRTDVSGLLPAAPFFLLALLPGPLARWERFLWLVVGLFTGGIIVTGTHGGLQWGPRYLLPILPPLVWLSAAAVARARATAPALWPSLRLAAGGLVAVSLLIQASGVDQVAEMMATNARTNAALRAALADVVVTPLEWVTLGSGPVYFEKSLMFVAQPNDFHALVTRLATAHVARWTYIPLSGPFFSPQAVEQWGSPSYRFHVADDRTEAGLRLVTFAGTLGRGPRSAP